MKVWILEMFQDMDDYKKMHEETKKMLGNKDLRPNQIEAIQQVLAVEQKRIVENPEGFWYGIEGKTIYKQFCREAQEALRRHKGDGRKFRVVEAEIKDGAETWLGYKATKVNEGVLKYLYATM